MVRSMGEGDFLMAATRVILVGGFLGAGKTTLVAQAAERLSRQGKRVGLVANDQAADLVDTELLKETGSQVEEVAGGCFCCRFPDMIGAMQRMVGESQRRRADRRAGRQLHRPLGHRAAAAQEAPRAAVRGCAVFRAGRRAAGAGARPAAAGRRPRMIAARFPDNVLYIYEKQLEEADLIVLNKADMLAAAELADLQAVAGRAIPRYAAADHVGR